jgi:D-serine dehydratase
MEARHAEHVRLDWRTKGLPPRAEGLTAAEIGGLGLNLLGGELLMPVAVLREDALRHNIAAMQDFADRHDARLCPHGKTTMSPELFAMQLAAGSWGLTAATAHHVRVYRRLGVQRIFLANELAAPADLDLVAAELAADPDFELCCLVDSAAGADLIAAAAERHRCRRPVQLVIETGVEGGRAGVRRADQALALARHVASLAPRLALRGIETFEGIHMARADARVEATELIDLALIVAGEIVREGLLAEGPLLVSAGGSGFLDLLAGRLPSSIAGRPVERIIRPGCYVTHDHGIYERLTRPDGELLPGLPELRPALEVWAPVLSVPEPGLAIVGAGKRDVAFDVEPPIPLWRHRAGAPAAPEPAAGMKVASLWDQHLSLATAEGDVAVGELIGFGISHPCAAFDRWRALLTVDACYRVTGAVTTLF